MPHGCCVMPSGWSTVERPFYYQLPKANKTIMQDQKTGNYRWVVSSLLFFAMTVNYLDRQVISLLKPILAKKFNWDESDYANIVIVFQLGYAVGMLGAGRIIDKIGSKIGYALALTLWSI